MELRPLILDGVEQPLKVKLHSYGFYNELFHFLLQKPLFVSTARLGPFGNDSAHALVNLEPALLDKVLNGFVRGVRVDFEGRCQRSNGRKGLAWLQLTADKGLLSSENHLIDDRFAGFELEANSCHTDNVTVVTGTVKKKFDRRASPWQVCDAGS